VNDKLEIELSKNEEVYSVLKKTTTELENDKSIGTTQTIDVYSYKLNMGELREFLNQIHKKYIVKIQNKLTSKTYFFNMINISAFVNPDGTKDFSRMPANFTFTLKKFETNRRFANVIGPEVALIQKRVEFFQKNKEWYDDKGIPYTLGLLLSGEPGTGKTSTIKCVANEMKRHIININLNNDITKSQMENLFFSDYLSVIIDGKTENIFIPVDSRVYVFEDIDCQNDLVMDREIKELPLQEKTEENFTSFNASDGLLSNYNTLLPNTNTPFAPPTEKINNRINIQTHAVKQKDNYQPSEQLTLSILLNLLDGILETPGRIIIMTSNYPELLDKALIRPGRIDLICKFRNCSNEMICDFLEKFYGIVLEEEDRRVVNTFTKERWTPAELSKVCFENFDDYKKAIQALGG
jgi:hypothetical protein